MNKPDLTFAPVLLFILSMATLALEIVQIRVFSYSINPVFVYMVISLALLGFGISGTVLSLVPKLRAMDLRATLAACLVLFTVSFVIANIVFARSSHLITPHHKISLLSPILPLFLLFTIPFFFSGLSVALVLLSHEEKVNRNYCINLLGSGAGCFVIYPFLRLLGAPTTVLVLALLCSVTGTIVAINKARAWAFIGIVTSLMLSIALFFPNRVLPYQPDSTDLLSNAVAQIEREIKAPILPEVVYSKWDPVGRIDLVRFEGRYASFGGSAPVLLFAQDGGAGSVLLGVGQHKELAKKFAQGTSYGLATHLRPKGEVLVIGLGGGPDLVASLTAGAARVTGVEINSAAIEAIRTHFRDFLGLPKPEEGRLKLVHTDGRAFVRQYRDHFDVIQMTGADTFAAGTVSGSLFSENYLYTQEAMLEYLTALKPNGILAITRFGMEGTRALTTAVKGLFRYGVQKPLSHLIVVQQGPVWVTLLVKKQPFGRSEIEQVKRFGTSSRQYITALGLPIYDTIGYRFDLPIDMIYYPGMRYKETLAALAGKPNTYYRRYYEALSAIENGTLDKWYAQSDFDFSPPTDDKPFFFHFPRLRWPSISEFLGLKKSSIFSAWDLTQYLVLIIQLLFVSLLLILGPLFAFKRRGLSLRSVPPLGVYFFAIGAGFMLVEIGLMQKLTLFLGHPNFSISTVLFSLLVFSGIGSLISARFGLTASNTVRIAVTGIFLMVVSLATWMNAIFDASLHLGIIARIIIAVMALAPLSFFMGVPFPTLLRRAEQQAPAFSAWAFGINGFASVLGSLCTIPLTMSIGFTATLFLGAAAYGLAWTAAEAYAWMVRRA